MTRDRELRHSEDACLDRAAEALDFDAATSDEVAAAATRRVNPLRRILRGLVRVGAPRSRD